MKKYLSFMAFALMAIFSLTFVSCGDDDDEPNGGSSSKGDYTFSYNGKTYYYGCTYSWPGLDINQTIVYAQFTAFESYGKPRCTLVVNRTQDTPIKMFDNDGNPIVEQENNSEVDLYFNLIDFNPQTAHSGDVLSFSQNVKQVTSNSYYDISNTILYREKSQGESDITYSWNGDAKGSVKFVSYKETEDGHHTLTLDFINITMVKVAGDNTSFSDKSEQVVVNGKITFTDNPTGIIE